MSILEERDILRLASAEVLCSAANHHLTDRPKENKCTTHGWAAGERERERKEGEKNSNRSEIGVMECILPDGLQEFLSCY